MNLSCMMMNEFVHDFYCFWFERDEDKDKGGYKGRDFFIF
jgi:hypothetical protein